MGVWRVRRNDQRACGVVRDGDGARRLEECAAHARVLHGLVHRNQLRHHKTRATELRRRLCQQRCADDAPIALRHEQLDAEGAHHRRVQHAPLAPHAEGDGHRAQLVPVVARQEHVRERDHRVRGGHREYTAA